MASTSTARTEAARAALAGVCDPEIPVLTIEDLGILRDVTVDDDGAAEVTITPTYSGCPAMDVIRTEVTEALQRSGFADVRVRTVLSPAWTTDWMTEEGKRKLVEYGIAPPSPLPADGPVFVALGSLSAACPRCGSTSTREVSRFGSTACKALRTCNDCLEPFDHFKAI